MEVISSFRHLQKEVKKHINEVSNEIKIAVLGNHTTTFFCKALENQLILADYTPHIYESDYDQIDITIIDSESELYKFNPEIIIVFESSLKLKDNFYTLNNNDEKSDFHKNTINSINDRVSLLRSKMNHSKIIYFSYELIDDQIYGNFFAKTSHSFYNQLWKINNELIFTSENKSDFYVFEINKYLKNNLAYRNWSSYINSDLHYSIDTFAYLTFHLTKFIKALKGTFNKCLILDLDNTTWGGIIGDDGLDNIQIGTLGIGKAYTKLQKWAKELKNRGVILAICSKNNEVIAKEPFEKHPEMILKLDDISVFVANWKNKADNIKYIQEVLNIGFDSMVFIDDNPAEREIIKQMLPSVTVPELPEDPSEYLPFLTDLNLFETASYSENDKDRTTQYQQEALRKKAILSTTNMNDYLKSLDMKGDIGNFIIEDVPRIAQLTQRSNQFNLRTKRYTEEDIIYFMNSSDHITYSIKLKDKFGDYGLISVIILEKKADNIFFIDTWIMSCRVLKRGVEYYALNKIVNDMIKLDVKFIEGEYLETKKNALVLNLLQKLTFENQKEKNEYKLNLSNYKSIKNHII